MILSISGKGGTGKTVFTALALKVLLESGKENILLVDADPATNLASIIGAEIKRTIGQVVERFRSLIEREELPPGIDKITFLEMLVAETLTETPKFDILSMGAIERASSCYCVINDLLTDIVGKIARNYDYVLMDMEAGLEHVSRRTDRNVDILFIVTDPSKMGFQTAKRIYELAKQVHISFGKAYLVGNMFFDGKEIREKLASLGIEIAGIIPFDPTIQAFNIEGKSLLELPDKVPSVIAVKEILAKVGLLS